jgi:hypothetical protein
MVLEFLRCSVDGGFEHGDSRCDVTRCQGVHVDPQVPIKIEQGVADVRGRVQNPLEQVELVGGKVVPIGEEASSNTTGVGWSYAVIDEKHAVWRPDSHLQIRLDALGSPNAPATPAREFQQEPKRDKPRHPTAAQRPLWPRLSPHLVARGVRAAQTIRLRHGTTPLPESFVQSYSKQD